MLADNTPKKKYFCIIIRTALTRHYFCIFLDTKNMNFVKSILALKPSTSSSIESGNNEIRQQATTFTTTSVTSGNSFIITTTVPTPPSSHRRDSEPQQLSIFHTSAPLSPDMAVSPTESFHSATSRQFEVKTKSEKSEKMGRTNEAFTGSSLEMNNNGHIQQSHLHNQ